MSGDVRWTRRGLVFGFLLAVASVMGGWIVYPRELQRAEVASLGFAAASGLLGAALVLRRRTAVAFGWLVVATAAGLWGIASRVLDNPSKDIRPLALEVARQCRKDERVVVLGRLESLASLVFYLKRPVVIATDHFGELQMARDAPEDAEASHFTDPATAQKWMRPEADRTFFVGQVDAYETFYTRQQGVRLHEVARHGRWIAWTNR